MQTIAENTLTDKGLDYLKWQIAKLNKRAAKLKLEPLSVEVIATEVKSTRHPVTGIEKFFNLHTVRVSGIVPRVDGWQVVAKIEFTEAGNFVTGIVDVKPEWRTVENRCDHCNKIRRRSDLVVIRHEDGREIIVGRNCLADYIRTGDAESLLAAADWSSFIEKTFSDCENESYAGGYRGGEAATSLETILQAASVCIRKLGWVPASAGEFAETTKSAVVMLLNPPRGRDDRYTWEKWVNKHNLIMNDHDAAEAVKAREFLATIPDNPGSDYLHNLRILRDLNFVPDSKIGLAVSIIAAAQKARDEAVKRAESSNSPREFVGTVGERLRGLVVTVKRIRSFEGNFGVTTIITFSHDKGELTWFASGDQTENYPEGETLTIDATVKEHKVDAKYGNSTIVNRVKESKPSKSKAAA